MPKNAKAIMGILLVFILGAVSGSLVTHLVHQARLERFISGGPGAREELILKRLTRQLDLDNNQQAQIRAIIHETHTAVREMRGHLRPQIEAVLQQGQTKISAVLRPEQREKFTKLTAERKARKFQERP